MECRKKLALDFGPVVLVYFSKPRSADAYGWLADAEAGEGPKMHRERFRSTGAALNRVRGLWGQAGFHHVSIRGPSGELLWASNDLRQMMESQQVA
jgi:hypothetical protein